MAYELCPNCDMEVEISGNKISKCPACGESIVPCSTCYDDMTKCAGCVLGSKHKLIKKKVT